MKTLNCLILAVLMLPGILRAKPLVEKPLRRHPTSFVIVVDRTTYGKTLPQLHAYRDALEADGLATYILCDDWQSPEEVRGELYGLMRRTSRRAPLEGAVFVGDIPIVLVRNAQHLTTAFKMDEEKFPINESSVPSDRYYDCPDLEFEPIARDSVNGLWFYRRLSPTSVQRLAPAFYSGRIRYPEQLGGDKYEGIARYLEKVVAERRRVDCLDHVVTYAGDGYNSDCLICWMDERIAMDENFPLTNTREASRLRQLNFRMDGYMKYRLFDELVRPEVDLFLFNEHGSPDAQHVGSHVTDPDSFEGIYGHIRDAYSWARIMEKRRGGKADPEGLRESFKKEYHLTDAFFEKLEQTDSESSRPAGTLPRDIELEDLADLPVQPRLVLFNACYNGSFHKPGNVAGYYLFGPGRTVVAQGNTVNVLQDRWTCEMVGLLSHAVRVGQYNRLIATLEGHVLGDPAFRFCPVVENDISQAITLWRNDASYWRALLESTPHADLKSLSLRMLADLGKITPGELLEIVRAEPCATTRMEALKLLGRFGDEATFEEGVRLGLNDRYELLRRNAATYAWQLGRPGLLPDLVGTLVNGDESQRVCYLAWKGLLLSPRESVDPVLREVVAASTVEDRDSIQGVLRASLDRNFRMKEHDRKQLHDGKTLAARISALRSMRNNTYHEYVPDLLQLLAAPSEPLELRVQVAECLGWFVHTPRRREIIDTCRRLAARTGEPSLKAELLQTALRLESTVSVPNTSK
ncbi:HEAT repeat domain-containing protein [Alistipes sp.]|uniref:HEAT repeat domain-containing protein n=1 Tax=Alistipes sp. TaxID=1872444 RepID=UPI0025BF1072|nr:HEAT repeat domain-containing protein [Alistipes sp.]